MQIRELSFLELQGAGLRGLTSDELAINLGIEPLQASGALSGLHKTKKAYRLYAKRENKSVYTVDPHLSNKTHRPYGFDNKQKRLRGTWDDIEAPRISERPDPVQEALPIVGIPAIVLFQDEHFTLTWRS